MPQGNWSDGVAKTVGQRVRHYRDRTGMSAQKMADALTELGLPIERSVLAGLESGRRKTVTVAEVIAFAEVLGVAPLALVYPVGDDQLVEVIPGHVADSYAAAKWFAGDAPRPESTECAGEAELWSWDGDLTALSRLRKHDRAMQLLLTAAMALQKTLMQGPFDVTSDLFRASGEMVRKIEGSVREERERLRQSGVTPPPLPDEFAHIDDQSRTARMPSPPNRPLPEGILSPEDLAAFKAQLGNIEPGMKTLVSLFNEIEVLAGSSSSALLQELIARLATPPATNPEASS